MISPSLYRSRFFAAATAAAILWMLLAALPGIPGNLGCLPSITALQQTAPEFLFQDGPVIPALTLPAGMPPAESGISTSRLAPRSLDGPTDPGELDRFLRPRFAEYMKQLHIPGAVFILVKDGKTFYKAGYGCANLERKTPVNPDRTLFRVASVSKLFIATAAMQLAEKHQLDLKADVNHYLKSFRLKKAYDQPVTMANLLTHTGGFDEQIIGMAARTEAEMTPLTDYLALRMPPQAMPPGEAVSYSNHGSALAGCVIQDVSGEPFPDYVEQHIFGPLQMNHSSFRLPPRLAPDLAAGYEYDSRSGENRAVPFDYLNIGPAGGLNTTASDMAHFMIAHLQGGRYGNERILQEATVREMQRQQFTHHPKLPGFAYGFFERNQNGQHGIEHGGLWYGFGSELFLLPAHHLGFFVSCNSGQPYLGELIVSSFLNHYFPARSGGPRRLELPAGSLARFVGSYRYNRYDRHTFLKLFAVYNELDVSADGDKALILQSAGGRPTRWIPVEPLVFRLEGRDIYLAFRQDGEGRVTNLFVGVGAFDRLEFYETNRFQGRLLIFALLALLAAAGPWNPALRRLWSRPPPGDGPASIWRADVLAQAMAIVNLVLMGVFFAAFRRLGFDVVYGVSFWWQVLLASAFVTVTWGARMSSRVGRGLAEGDWAASERVPMVLSVLGSASLALFLWYWNLLIPVF